ncbi:GreA/GreB family elongation factor [Sphingomonas glacialis]|uniref:Nucleoside-diphosphate kinase n=1 Tax=Sphingomonas glacialis TaxID=658225 RepID=A0A502FJM8_9SPHN|nr:GreA/GreB family elongation factor [Sphingomonas glacialis]TPG49665.1 nucleoside-diphosphate kinase [Sphingomonas glacialis]
MSVAFRRESDEEHMEPKFERPIAPGPNLVTPRGLALIGAKVVELEAAVAGASVEDRDAALRELRYWHTRQTTAEVVAAPAEGEVGIGSSVTYRLNGAERSVEIVGGDEADPAAGKIGYQAPLARALIGAEVGERVDFAGKDEAIEIVAVA